MFARMYFSYFGKLPKKGAHHDSKMRTDSKFNCLSNEHSTER